MEADWKKFDPAEFDFTEADLSRFQELVSGWEPDGADLLPPSLHSDTLQALEVVFAMMEGLHQVAPAAPELRTLVSWWDSVKHRLVDISGARYSPREDGEFVENILFRLAQMEANRRSTAGGD